MSRSHRDHLIMIPKHMRDSICQWIENPLPPEMLGSFLRALLENDLSRAFMCADESNALAMRSWAEFLYNHAPSQCWGSPEKVQTWYEMHHKLLESTP